MPNNTPKRHVTKYVLLSLLAALLLFITVFILIDCVHYWQDKSPYRTFIVPRMELAVFEVTTLTADKADMVGRVLIHSPLPFNLRADSLNYKIFIGGVEVVKSTYEKSLDIKKWDSTWIDLPVTTYTNKLVDVLKNAENAGQDSIVYEVQASFGTNLVVHKHFDLDIKKLLPVLYIPEVKMDSLLYDSLSVKGVTLILPVTIINKNKMAFKVKDLDFKFKLADNKWVEGTRPGVIDIKEQSETPLTLPVRIYFDEIGKSLGTLIREGKKTDFQLNVTMRMVSDNNALKNSLVILNDAGTLKEIAKLAKEEKKKSKEKEKMDKANGIAPNGGEKKTKLKIKKKKTGA